MKSPSSNDNTVSHQVTGPRLPFQVLSKKHYTTTVHFLDKWLNPD